MFLHFPFDDVKLPGLLRCLLNRYVCLYHVNQKLVMVNTLQLFVIVFLFWFEGFQLI